MLPDQALSASTGSAERAHRVRPPRVLGAQHSGSLQALVVVEQRVAIGTHPSKVLMESPMMENVFAGMPDRLPYVIRNRVPAPRVGAAFIQ